MQMQSQSSKLHYNEYTLGCYLSRILIIKIMVSIITLLLNDSPLPPRTHTRMLVYNNEHNHVSFTIMAFVYLDGAHTATDTYARLNCTPRVARSRKLSALAGQPYCS